MTTITTNLQCDDICVIGDIHLGIHQNSQMWFDISTKWSKWLNEELDNKGVKDIIICGDLFHDRAEISVNTIDHAVNVIKNFKDKNIIILVGNHDAFYKNRSDITSLSMFDQWPNVTVVYNNQLLKYKDKTLGICPWGCNIDEFPNVDILFGHFEIESFKLNSMSICTHGTNPNQLLSKSDLIVSGHLHIGEDRTYSNGRILYTGNPFQMDFGDLGHKKGYYILNVPSKTLAFHENKKSPKHIKLVLTNMVKSKMTMNTIQKHCKGNIVKLVVDMCTVSEDIDTLNKKIQSTEPLQYGTDIKYTTNSVHTQNQDTVDIIDIPTMITEFIGKMDIDNREDIISYTLNLYNISK